MMAPLSVAGLALAASTFNLTHLETNPLTEGVGMASFHQLVRFLSETPPDTLLLSWNPRVFALYTRRPSALYPQEAENFERQIPAATHVLLIEYAQPLDHDKLGVYLGSSNPRPPEEFSNPEFKVYRIR